MESLVGALSSIFKMAYSLYTVVPYVGEKIVFLHISIMFCLSSSQIRGITEIALLRPGLQGCIRITVNDLRTEKQLAGISWHARITILSFYLEKYLTQLIKGKSW